MFCRIHPCHFVLKVTCFSAALSSFNFSIASFCVVYFQTPSVVASLKGYAAAGVPGTRVVAHGRPTHLYPLERRVASPSSPLSLESATSTGGRTGKPCDAVSCLSLIRDPAACVAPGQECHNSQPLHDYIHMVRGHSLNTYSMNMYMVIALTLSM